MSYVPPRPSKEAWNAAPDKGTPQLPGQVVETARAADRVLFGPAGEVLIRIEDRKQIGFRR